MPITQHGVTMQDAYLEAATAAPTDRTMLDCFSLYHPIGGALYFVNDFEPFTALLEDGVTEVEFLACSVRIQRPEESDQASTPQVSISIDNISGAVSDKLKAIRGSRAPWVLTNYLYSSDDPTQPAVMPPTVMEIVPVKVDSQTATLTGSFGDAGNVAIPALTFKRAAYPGLVR